MSGIVGTEGSKSGIIGQAPTGRFSEWHMTSAVSSTGVLGNGNINNSVQHGLNVTVSSGVFTLPENGVYKIEFSGNTIYNGNTRYPYVYTHLDFGANGTYVVKAYAMFQMADMGDNSYNNIHSSISLNCSAGDLVKFVYAGSAVSFQGHVTENLTYFRFTKIKAV
tara:strand:+ start:133 stop:627 length:495 start_codon:yes stop_codon:yes gene_type:complete